MREIGLFFGFFTVVISLCLGITDGVFAQSVECGQAIDFGSIVANVNGGKISISQNGTTLGGANEKVEARGNAGVFRLGSPIAEKVNVQLSATYLYGDGKDIKVANVAHDGSNNFDVELDEGVEKNISTSAEIEYFAGQKIGLYSGFWTVVANFETSKTSITEMCPISVNFNAKEIQVTEIASLNFGSVSKPAGSGGVVRVSSSGGYAVVSGNLQFLSNVTSGKFMVEASPETTVYISFEDGILYSGGNSISVKNFTTNKGKHFSIPSTGNTTVKVGADLVIENNQPAGNYNGTYGVIINY